MHKHFIQDKQLIRNNNNLRKMSAAAENGIDNIVYQKDDNDGDETGNMESPRYVIPINSSSSNIHTERLGDSKSASIDTDQITSIPWVGSRSPSTAVLVQNACKSYGGTSSKGSTPVLKNLNMTVTQGTIYSLLGSSGCGKTTLLACVVGLRRLNSGEIYTLGAKPGTKNSGVPGKRVGYMPQEIALFGEFTIQESLYFYGRMYSMTTSMIQENIQFLMDFLNLPPKDRSVKNLSGGQQRRVSFACSLIHNPELLLLDEPTVGVDSLLRKSIWEHLIKLVSTGKTTVIITTHYVEEARQSNTIGLMRNGKLLVEDSPDNLLRKYNTDLLEDIVMKLCLRDSTSTDNDENEFNPVADNNTITAFAYNKEKDQDFGINGEVYHKIEDNGHNQLNSADVEIMSEFATRGKLHRASLGSETRTPGRKEQLQDSWNRFVTLTHKNFLTSIRNLLFLIFILVCPTLQVIVVCLAIGGVPKGLDFAIINHELGLNESCDPHSRWRGCPLNNDSYSGLLSCHFISLLDNDAIIVKMFSDENKALKDVRDSVVWGVVTFPSNFTQDFMERAIFGPTAELDSIYGSQIAIQMDFSNKQIASEIGKVFYATLNNMMRNISLECGLDTLNLALPLSYQRPVYGTEKLTFREYIAPSVLLGCLFFFPATSSGLNYIAEKRLGTLDRSLVAGVTIGEFMLAYSAVQLIILFIQTNLAFVFIVWVFGINVSGPFACAYSMALLVGFAGASAGFILSTICSQEVQAVLISMGMFLPNLLLAGIIWPLEGVNIWLQYFSYVLPCTLACESMRSIVSRGVGLSHPKVWPGFVSTVLWIIFYWVLLAIINRLKSSK